MTDEDFLKMIGCHSVAVVWQDRLKDEAAPSGGTVFSAFIMSIGGRVVLVTAGHVVEVIQDRQKQGRILVGARIYDSWTCKPLTKDGFTFIDIGDAEQGYEYSDDLGLDYAWFVLREHHVKLLAANNVIPLAEAAWRNPPTLSDFVGFNCFGFPDDINAETRDKNGAFIGMRVKPRLIPYEPAEPKDDRLRTKHPRVFFMPGGSADGSVPELAGMSGGPIFGYAKQGKDLRYWLLGVQSGQAIDPPRLATACPIQNLIESVAKALEKKSSSPRDKESTN